MKIRKVLNGLNGQIPIFYHSPTIRKHEIFFDQIAKSSYFSIYGSGFWDTVTDHFMEQLKLLLNDNRIFVVTGSITKTVYILTDRTTGERFGYSGDLLTKVEIGRIIKII